MGCQEMDHQNQIFKRQAKRLPYFVPKNQEHLQQFLQSIFFGLRHGAITGTGETSFHSKEPDSFGGSA
jgi:hypothetical protein